MTGKELIKWIQDNKAEDLNITYHYMAPWEIFEGYAKELNPIIIKEEGRVEL